MKNTKKKTVTSPKSALHTSPKDVFLHLLMMVMLYIGVISLISLAFSYINYSFPDPLSFYLTGILDNIRIQSSMLVVSFPLLLILASFIQRGFRKTPAKHELKFSKWLVYLTLFVAALTIVIDLIQLVNRFYGGELTTPFMLKVLSVLIVTGAVFGYYIWDVQSEPYKSRVPRTVAWAASVVVLGMLVSGFFIVGSPTVQRQIRMDEQRISDLQRIQGEVVNYWQLKRTLPVSLGDLRNDISGFSVPVDPETGTSYEYLVSEPLQFSLCAVFNQESLDDRSSARMPEPAYSPEGFPKGLSDSWSHGPGHVCFERQIDPELYPQK